MRDHGHKRTYVYYIDQLYEYLLCLKRKELEVDLLLTAI